MSRDPGKYLPKQDEQTVVLSGSNGYDTLNQLCSAALSDK